MQPNNFFASLQASSLAVLLDGSRYIAMSIQIVHLLALTFLLGLVLAINIRVLRLSLRALPVGVFARAMTKPYVITLMLAIVAGILLFLPRAATYATNVAFIWKMALVLTAGTSQLFLLRHISVLPAKQEASLPLRIGSLLTLVLWIATGVAGRAIGFV
jgi:hypothetical protein